MTACACTRVRGGGGGGRGVERLLCFSGGDRGLSGGDLGGALRGLHLPVLSDARALHLGELGVVQQALVAQLAQLP